MFVADVNGKVLNIGQAYALTIEEAGEKYAIVAYFNLGSLPENRHVIKLADDETSAENDLESMLGNELYEFT